MEDCTRYILAQLSVHDTFIMRYVNIYFRERCPVSAVSNSSLLHWASQSGYVDILLWLVTYLECSISETLKSSMVYEAMLNGRKKLIQTLIRLGVTSMIDVRTVANNLLENQTDSLSFEAIECMCELRVPKALKLATMDARETLFQFILNESCAQVVEFVTDSGTILTNDLVLRIARLDNTNSTAANNFFGLLKLGLISHITYETSIQYVPILVNTKNKLVGQRSNILLKLIARGLRLICPKCAKLYKIRDSYISHLYVEHGMVDIRRVLST